VKIRITNRMPGADYEGFDVSHLIVGQVYDIAPGLATLLVVGGYAMPEMRTLDRAAQRRSKLTAHGRRDKITR
jgi:hypothetical protein